MRIPIIEMTMTYPDRDPKFVGCDPPPSNQSAGCWHLATSSCICDCHRNG